MEQEKQLYFFLSENFFSTGGDSDQYKMHHLVSVRSTGAFSTDRTVPGKKPVLTRGSCPVLMSNFLVVELLWID